MTPLRLTKAGKACKSHHHCQLWRSHSSLQLEEYVHKTASHVQGATGFIPNQELRRKARGTWAVSPLLLGQGCVPSKLYSNTDSSRGFGHTASSLHCFSHFPQRKNPSFPSWELLLTAVVCSWWWTAPHMRSTGCVECTCELSSRVAQGSG